MVGYRKMSTKHEIQCNHISKSEIFRLVHNIVILVMYIITNCNYEMQRKEEMQCTNHFFYKYHPTLFVSINVQYF